ncbi:MAG: M15 family metallopeptidase [Kofleriaceae bacterium]|nr:M15 family metallopeptidase [Kofleriaceae bacterium]
MSTLLRLAGPLPAYQASIALLDNAVFERVRDCSWRDHHACPPRAALRYLRISHHTFEGAVAQGELIVAAAIATPTVALFARLWRLGFPIASMRLVDDFAGSDDASMAANNSSAFNFRTVAGTDLLSRHAEGLAIDINPVQNPWLRPPLAIVPAAGVEFSQRTHLRPGMLVRPGPVVAAFDELGWEWGGDWRHAFDYHHIVWRGRA